MAGKRNIESKVLEWRVIDGDSAEITLDLGHYVRVETIIRLIDIDTPEVNTEAGKLVKKVVERWFRKLVEDGRDGFLMWRSAILDKYRRSLGDFFDAEHPSESLTGYLQKHGLCVKYSGSGARIWSDLTLKAIEEHAKEVLAIG